MQTLYPNLKYSTHATQTIGLSCPQCSSKKFTKNGTSKEKQRFICKQCKRTFSHTINTPLHRLRKTHLIPQYIEALTGGQSIRQVAKSLNISIQTAFSWRHKLLTSVNTPTRTSSNTVKAIEILNHPYSQKGTRNRESDKKRDKSTTILISDSNNQISIQKLEHSNIRKQISNFIQQSNIQEISPVKRSKLLTYSINKTQAKTALSKHLHELKTKAKHISVEIECWLQRFRGVATKYLSQYWGWIQFLLNNQQLKNIEESLLKNCVSTRNLSIFSQLKAQT